MKLDITFEAMRPLPRIDLYELHPRGIDIKERMRTVIAAPTPR
jgi:hypothetical protein